MKKIGIFHIGSRISSDITKLINYNLIAFSRVLSENNHVFLYTKVLKKDNFKMFETETFSVRDIFKKEHEDLDEMIVYTSDINFYGGADSPEIMYPYFYINKFIKKDKPVWYFNNDLSYFLRDPMVLTKNRKWADNYPESDFGIDGLKLKVLHQYTNPDVIEKFKELNSKELNSEIVQSEFINFSLLNSKFMDTPNFVQLTHKESDLLYYGFHRYGKRTKEMVKYYYNIPETVIHGTINKYEDSINKKNSFEFTPTFKGKLDRKILFDTLKKSISTVIISDPDYMEYGNIPTRFYEAVNSGVITFVSEGTDRHNEFFGECFDFLKVKSSSDVKQKIREIKTWSDEKYIDFLDLQKSLAYSRYNIRKEELFKLFK